MVAEIFKLTYLTIIWPTPDTYPTLFSGLQLKKNLSVGWVGGGGPTYYDP